MSEVFNSIQDTKIKIALEATKLLIQQKLIFNKSHEVGIVLMGTEETDNELNSTFGGYTNITTVSKMDQPSLDTLRFCNEVTTTNSRADLLDALVLGMHLINEKCGTKKYNRRIFMLTDGNSTCDNDDQLPDIVDQMNTQLIKLNVIAIGFGEDQEEGVKLEVTAEQSKTEDVLKRLCANVQGRVYPSAQAMEIYRQFRKRAVYPVAKFKGALEFGENHGIDIAVYTKTRAESMPSLKKHSGAVDFTADAKTGLVKMSREAALADDPNSKALEQDDIIKAFHYGKSVVPVSKDEEALVSLATEKCMKLIGFTSKESISRDRFMGGVEMVLPQAGYEGSFTALAQAMHQRNDVAIVKFCPRNKQAAKLVVLTPKISQKTVCFWLNYLPTLEDIREYDFAPLREATEAQLQAADEFVDAMTLEIQDEDGDTEELLAPQMTFNPALQYFYQCITWRADHPDEELPPLDPNIAEYLNPEEAIFEGCKTVCDKFAGQFNLVVKEKTGQEKKLYSDVIKQEDKPDDQYDVAEPFSDTISEHAPVEDFYRLLKDRVVDRVTQAINQMKGMIIRFVEHSYGGNNFPKAIDCLKNLRQGCLDEDEIQAFNEFMIYHIKPMKQNSPEFWNQVVRYGLSLISKIESDKSAIEEIEAQEFLVKVEEQRPEPAAEDELLDDIE